MWNLKNKVNEQTKQKKTQREQTDGCQRRGAGLGEKGEESKTQIGSYKTVTEM